MIAKNISGKFGEKYAADYLKQKGYRILCRNYKAGIAEIDIIAVDGDCLCFIEVKTRKNKDFGYASDAVNSTKIHKITLGAKSYLLTNSSYSKYRFDVVEVYGDIFPGGFAVSEINIIKNAFEV